MLKTNLKMILTILLIFLLTFSGALATNEISEFQNKNENHFQNKTGYLILQTLQRNDVLLKQQSGSPPLLQDSSNSSDVECRYYHDLNISDVCQWIKDTDDCQIDEGLINYTEVVFCQFPSPAAGVVILFFWWLFLFVGLATSADDFFCPSLAVMSETMRLSHNIAGVTLLAFGNGAPDIFSAIAAIGNAKNGDAGLALGALIGAGVFVTTIVPAAIALVVPFKAMERPFIRDIVFYLVAVFATFVVLYHRHIVTAEAIAFIGLYVVYVIVVVVGRYIYQAQKKKRNINLPNIQDFQDDGVVVRDPASLDDPISAVEQPDESTPLLDKEFDNTDESPLKEFLNAINPIDVDDFREKKIYWKIYELFKSPLLFIFTVTTPIVEPERPKKNWNRHLNSLHCVTSPMFCILAAKHDVALSYINGVFPVLALVFLVGIPIAALVYFTSKNDEPPIYHTVFAFIGFFVSVIWIYAIANEIVNILQMFGVVFNLSNAVLGLTLLAWGNSIGDLVADTVMAKSGYPRTGISACFGGPLFNLLLGVGIPFTIGCINKGGIFYIQFTFIQVILLGFLALSLLSSLIYLVIFKFYISRAYGVYLICLYVTFLIVALLVETGVIDVQFN